MTLNSKILSLVLLTGLTMGGAFARKQKQSESKQDCHTEQWSSCIASTPCTPCPVISPTAETKDCCDLKVCCDLCTDDCNSCKKQLDCCKDCKQILCFETGLSYEQTLNPFTCSGTSVIGGNPQDSNYKPKGFCGKLEVCFDKQLTQFCYRLTLCGADKIEHANQQPLVGYFFSGVDACSPVSVASTSTCTIAFPLQGGTTASNWINVPVLIGSSLNSVCGLDDPLFCRSACITQQRLGTSGGSTNHQLSIACIYQDALAGLLKFIVFGTSGCEGTGTPTPKSFAFNSTDATKLTGGVLAGNLRPCSPCC